MNDVLYLKDYSHWSEVRNYDVEALKIRAAYAKATEGDWFHDSLYGKHMWNFEERGVPSGAYHYYREGYDPKKQAWLFWQLAKTRTMRLPPALDIESINNKRLDAGNIYRCLKEIEQMFGRKPIVYTGFFVWRDMMKSPTWSTDYLLWLATYNKMPMIPKPWTGWTIWQFNDAFGDENWFNGGDAELQKFMGETYHQAVLPEVVKPVNPTQETQKPTPLLTARAKFKWIWNTKKKQWVQKKAG